jgi:lipopolysaccharide/colanic/teichoic acid biosynthesis glycosyltransferase
MQRVFDIILSSLALIILLPLLVPIAILLLMTGEGEIFYLQDRIGKNGKTIKLYKFATMLKNSPSLGTGTVTVKNDSRILPAGKFLRKTKINELPQLLNILSGDMSVIGPRPLTKQTFGAYSADTQGILGQVRPGLSGVGSIIFRGEEDILAGANSSLDFYMNSIAPYKGDLETWFVRNYSLQNYFKAIIVTLVVVLFPKSQIAWKVFKGLPVPPDELKNVLSYVVAKK